MKRSKLLYSLGTMVFLALSFTGLAQLRTISGTVQEAKNNSPLDGATVTLKNTNVSTVTNSTGTFEISVPQGKAELEVSYVGHDTKSVTVSANEANVIVALSLSAKGQLSDVVVVGYGTQKSSHVTSAIARIKGDDLNDRPASTIDHAMGGKLAGVQVQEVSGAPGKSLSVKVRGKSSVNFSNTPLYVVDGFPVSSGLDNINPEDIESIEVLKDAASAAIYGSRGSSGVILVTTKTGKIGKPVLQFDTYVGFQKRLSKYDLLDTKEYIDFAIEERNNTWMLQGGKASDPNSVRPSAFWIDPVWSDAKSLPDRDWQKLIEQPAPIQNYQLSASGATDNVKYYVSANYFSQKGIIIGSDYNRFSFHTNAETKAGKFVSLGLNLTASNTITDDSNGDDPGGGVSRSQYMLPFFPLNGQTEAGGYNPYYASFIINPVSLLEDLTKETNTKSFRANTYLTIAFTKSLKLKSSFGVDYADDINQYYKPTTINKGLGSAGNTSTTGRSDYLTEHTLTYQLRKDKWNLDALAGFSYQFDKVFNSSLAKTGFADDDITTLNAGTVISSGTSSMTEWGLMSFFGRINLSRSDKYLLSASIRRDGSSRFGADNRWGWFPAVSTGWNVYKEEFFQNVNFISNLKIRASYGQTGNNNIGNYAAIGTLNNANYALGQGGSETIVTGYTPGSFSNRMLGWEKTATLDLGADIGLINNRVNLTMDYYVSETNNLLLNVPIPATVGFTTTLQNIGKVRNSGVELELNTMNLVGKFKWNTAFNITYNENKVLQLGPNNAPVYGSSVISNITITKVGEPIGSYYLFVQDGVFKDQEDFDSHPHYKSQQIGDIKYKDINGDGVINADDRTVVGNNSPKFFYGFQNTFSYRNFDLYTSVDGQWGNKLITVAGSSDGQSRANVRGYWRERWRSPEDPGNGWVPRAAITANLTTPSTFWLRDASYWRIRTVSLGYNVPRSLFDKVGLIQSLRISANVDNLYQHDNNMGSPQTGNQSNTNAVPGVDYGTSYPLARTFTLNLNVKF